MMNKFLFLMLFLTSSYVIACDEKVELCSRLSEIKVIPFKGERVKDPVYNGLRGLGNKALPCLIEQVLNTNLMDDPRKIPPYKGIKVGDIAFFIISDISGASIVELVQDKSVKSKFVDQGVYAYFEYIDKPGAREKLRNSIEKKLIKKTKKPTVSELKF